MLWFFTSFPCMPNTVSKLLETFFTTQSPSFENTANTMQPVGRMFFLEKVFIFRFKNCWWLRLTNFTSRAENASNSIYKSCNRISSGLSGSISPMWFNNFLVSLFCSSSPSASYMSCLLWIVLSSKRSRNSILRVTDNSKWFSIDKSDSSKIIAFMKLFENGFMVL